MNQLPQTGGSYRRDEDGALVPIETAEGPAETGAQAATAEPAETNETDTDAGVTKTTRGS